MKSVSLSKRLYQRSVPICIVAFIIGFMTVQYFIKYAPLDALQGQTLIWANIVSLWVWAFANVVLVLNALRRVSRARQEDPRAWYESAIMLASIVVILLIAFIDPANLDRNPIYSTIYKGLIGAIYLGIESTGITYQVYNILKRLVTARITLETLIIIVTYLLMGFRSIALITYNVPLTFTIAEWIEKVAYSTTARAITIVSAIGTLILAVRALVGKEPGIIEMDMG